MNIDILVANLQNTIDGKEALLQRVTHPFVREFIQINVNELKRILVDAKVVQKQVIDLEVRLDGFVHGSL